MMTSASIVLRCAVSLATIGVCGAGLQSGAADEPSSESVAKVDQFLHARTSPFPFSGSVLVAMDGKVALSKGYGEAEAELGMANRPEMIYRIGSLSKPITATAMMSLVEKHQISLDDSVCRYVRTCPASWSRVLVRHLLSHTSGIPDLFNAIPAAPVAATRDAIDQTITKAANLAPDSEPGTKHVYRNFNYMLVGYIIEVVTGKTWGDVLKSAVFDPAGMVDTAYDDVWAIVPNRVRGYDVKGGKLRNIVYKDHSAFAAGGLRATTADLWAFAQAFSAGKLVQPATAKQMLTPVLGDYGLGWQVKQFFGHRMFNHTGDIDGFASHLAIYPDQNLIIVVLSNIESEPAKLTACNIASVLLTSSTAPLTACPER